MSHLQPAAAPPPPAGDAPAPPLTPIKRRLEAARDAGDSRVCEMAEKRPKVDKVAAALRTVDELNILSFEDMPCRVGVHCLKHCADGDGSCERAAEGENDMVSACVPMDPFSPYLDQADPAFWLDSQCNREKVLLWASLAQQKIDAATDDTKDPEQAEMTKIENDKTDNELWDGAGAFAEAGAEVWTG